VQLDANTHTHAEFVAWFWRRERGLSVEEEWQLAVYIPIPDHETGHVAACVAFGKSSKRRTCWRSFEVFNHA
jgi:hypothetical protein